MHLESGVIEDLIANRLMPTAAQAEHLTECEACRNAFWAGAPHIDPKRLDELAQMDVILKEPEWPHMRKCDGCLSAFAAFVRFRAEAKGECA
jgi:hypothetical protein